MRRKPHDDEIIAQWTLTSDEWNHFVTFLREETKRTGRLQLSALTQSPFAFIIGMTVGLIVRAKRRRTAEQEYARRLEEKAPLITVTDWCVCYGSNYECIPFRPSWGPVSKPRIEKSDPPAISLSQLGKKVFIPFPKTESNEGEELFEMFKQAGAIKKIPFPIEVEEI